MRFINSDFLPVCHLCLNFTSRNKKINIEAVTYRGVSKNTSNKSSEAVLSEQLLVVYNLCLAIPKIKAKL